MNARAVAALLVAGLQAVATDAHAADDALPRLAASAASPRAFAPAGYVVEQADAADLDGDGISDAAVLLVPDCGAATSDELLRVAGCRAEGRLLAIVLGQRTGGFRLSAVARIRSGVGLHGDGFYDMTVRDRVVSLRGGSFTGAGEDGAESTLRFRFQQGEWRLIGQDDRAWHARPSEGRDPNPLPCPGVRLRRGEACVERRRSTNFNTGHVESAWRVQNEDEADDGGRRVVVRTKLPKRPPARLVDTEIAF